MTGRWLDQIGIKRTIALRVAHFTIAPEIVKQTDLAVVFPSSMARRFNHSNDFCLLSIPADTQEIEVKAHARVNFSGDSGINWLRDLVIELFATGA